MKINVFVKKIDYKSAISFLLPRHYSGRKPNIKFAYGLFEDGLLTAVCTFGIPASRSLCVGVCGEKYSKNIIELNRLLSVSENYVLSKFVSKCLKLIKKEGDFVVVSYADTDMNHNGYIYQATNFKYTGKTKERTDKYTEGNKHSRHYNNEMQNGLRRVRSAKHRYIYFCTNNKDIISSLKYKEEPYPKGENKKYKLGDFLKPKIIIDAKSKKEGG